MNKKQIIILSSVLIIICLLFIFLTKDDNITIHKDNSTYSSINTTTEDTIIVENKKEEIKEVYVVTSKTKEYTTKEITVEKPSTYYTNKTNNNDYNKQILDHINKKRNDLGYANLNVDAELKELTDYYASLFAKNNQISRIDNFEHQYSGKFDNINVLLNKLTAPNSNNYILSKNATAVSVSVVSYNNTNYYCIIIK